MNQFTLKSETFARAALFNLSRRETTKRQSRLSDYNLNFDSADLAAVLPSDLLPDTTEPAQTQDCPIVANYRPAEDLPVALILAALQLGVVLEDTATLLSMARPGALTVISTHSPEEMQLTVEALERGFLPLIAGQTGDAKVQVVRPEGMQFESTSSRSGLEKNLNSALESRAPILLILPWRGYLAPELESMLTPTHQTPRINAPLLMAVLRQTHTDLSSDDLVSLAGAFPSDAQLRTLTPQALSIACRAETPAQVVQKIGLMVRSHLVTGHNMDAFDPHVSAVAAVRDMLADLADWTLGCIDWSEMLRSIIITGPPGSGKTFLARAAATTAGVPLIATSFAAWQSHGNLSATLAAMNATFKKARDLTPSILFIDEIDSCGNRTRQDHNSSYTDQLINGFLLEIDETARCKGVLIIGATNRIGAIDPAVLRPGRFDRVVEMGLPNLMALRQIVRTSSSNMLEPDAVDAIARAAVGCSAAAIDGAIRAAKSHARRNGLALTAVGVIAALSTHVSNPRLEHRISLHECGHATLAILHGRTIDHISLGMESGEVQTRHGLRECTLEDYVADLEIILAGRAAEQVLLYGVSGGAGGRADSDLARATQLAADIELQLGLGQQGNVWSPVPLSSALQDPRFMSAVRHRLDRAYARACKAITVHAQVIRAMAAALVEARELTATDIDEWADLMLEVRTAEMASSDSVVVPFSRP